TNGPFCDDCIETDWHTFVDCDQAQKLWMESGLWQFLQALSNNFDDIKGIIFHILGSYSSANIDKFVAFIWCIWRQRNEKLWEGVQKPSHVVTQLALHYLDWKQIHCKEPPLHTQQASISRNN
ncbi:hypothetical protein glysoja_012104, partial [Glycine soja]